ncbi:hypothetical protein M8998_13800 [Sphingobacterium sp. lm-10]|uniref:hypothetical protein n=1 Tax=Sphingobacterium sp. lm-10 TaxID=2944904 RepID=UPI002022385A|nr:hypothetical protein [Sphingobacterium sp. lm-10]MCL7989020.1 hypothetical protein [Sphingobacterium sp. lm-10]
MHQLYTLYSVLCISFLALAVPATAQQIPTQASNCEQVTEAALPKIISLLNNNDFTAMEQVLQTIESNCGPNEVTQRIRIIGQLILKQPTNALIRDYLQQGKDNELMIRWDDASEDDYQNIYRKNKATYHYVPLRHSVDSLTQVKATAIIGSDLYNLNETEEAISYLFSDHISTYLIRMQKEKPVTRMEKMQEVELYKGGWGFAMSAGLYRPLNATNPVYNDLPIYGFSFISPLANDWVFDGFFKYRPARNSRIFEYQSEPNSTLPDELEPLTTYMFGGSAGYKFFDAGKFLMLGKAGLAYEMSYNRSLYLSYGDGAPVYITRPQTFNLSTGVSAMQHVGRTSFIGAQIQYHYSPYSIDSRLITPIASDYVSFELFFKF